VYSLFLYKETKVYPYDVNRTNGNSKENKR